MNELDTIEGYFWHNEETDVSHPNPNKAEKIIDQILTDHDSTLGCINIILCSDEYLLQVNQEYLDHDYYTDIITFPINNEPLSADLFISVDRVHDNAESRDSSFIDELNRVIYHGVLHLVGYGDKSEEEITVMRAKEAYYLGF